MRIRAYVVLGVSIALGVLPHPISQEERWSTGGSYGAGNVLFVWCYRHLAPNGAKNVTRECGYRMLSIALNVTTSDFAPAERNVYSPK